MSHADDWQNPRSAFHLPGSGPYALSHSVGCLPEAARVAVESGYLRPWREQGGGAWDEWLQGIEAFRIGLARLLGGDAASYCPQPNLSSALAKLLGALPRVSGRSVVLAAEDSFPSLGFVVQQARRLGYELRLIPRSSSPAKIETWADALSRDVRAALVTHVHSNTGEVAPVGEIARLCASRDIPCVVDVAQSAGILPVSLPDCGAHVVLGSCVKWLCGGPGAGFMWVSPAIVQSLQPSDVGWFSHADPFEFDIHHFEYASDARRFWGGTPTVVPYVAAAASLRLMAGIGVPAIHAHNRRLIDAFLGALPEAWRTRIRTENIGGTLCIDTGAALQTIRQALTAAAVQFDCRGPVVRLSFHIYNTPEEALQIARAWKGAGRHSP
jgi:kynureninase